PFRQHGIEQAAAYRRQPETFQLLLAWRLTLTAQPGAAAYPVSLCTAETLLAKVVWHATRGDQRQPRIQVILALQLAHHQLEIITPMGATIELAGMAHALQQLHTLGPLRPLRIGLARQVQAEPLLGYRLAILQATVAHSTQRQLCRARQPQGQVGGIPAGLAHEQPQMLTAVAGLER